MKRMTSRALGEDEDQCPSTFNNLTQMPAFVFSNKLVTGIKTMYPGRIIFNVSINNNGGFFFFFYALNVVRIFFATQNTIVWI